MVYMGGKIKLAKYIVPIIQDFIDKSKIKVFVDAFVGGANIIDKVICEKKIGADINEFLIELYINKEKVKDMPYISKELYDDVRTAYNHEDYKKYSKWFIGAVGFLSSYNGRFFDGGYSGLRKIKGGERDYYLQKKENFIEQSKALNGIEFITGDYRDTCKNIKGALIYCDPPYKNTKKYKVEKFDSDAFWEWVREKSKDNIILVSEQTSPEFAKCIWEKEIKRTINNKGRKQATEKLFIVQ